MICPRQIIFKRFKNIDLRLRFSYLFEETDADADQIRDYFEVFGKPIDFDFNNLLQNKVYNYLQDNIIRENEQIQTVNQETICRPEGTLMPGSPALRQLDQFKYYGYYSKEITIKQSQIINVLGDFPTFDYTLEAELGSDNLRYIGPKASL